MRALLFSVLLLGAGLSRDAKQKEANVMGDEASREKLQNHFYERTPMELADAARAWLTAQGYAAEVSEDPLVFDTPWKEDGKGRRSRYHVQVVAVSVGSAQIELTKIQDDPLAGNMDGGVDLGAEWELMTKLDPAAAGEISSAAPTAKAVVDTSPAPAPQATARSGRASAPTPIAVPTAAPSITAAPTKRAPEATRAPAATIATPATKKPK